MVIPWSSFQQLPKPSGDDLINPEFVRLQTRQVENFGGDESKF